MSIKAMKQALDALEIYAAIRADKAIATLRQAIAEAKKQKPVVWFDSNACEGDENQVFGMKTKRHTTPLYTHPPKREWVSLTEEEAAECWNSSAVTTWKNIEAKLREKNGC